MACFDVAVVIEEFLADPARSSLELPNMTSGQRKQAKKLASMHPELRCESYGFGQERQLHLFKGEATTLPSDCTASEAQERIASLPRHAVHVKNTFIDGWSVPEEEGVIFRSMPTRLNKFFTELEGTLPSVSGLQASALKLGGVSETDCSTSASAGTPSDAEESDSHSSATESTPFRLQPLSAVAAAATPAAMQFSVGMQVVVEGLTKAPMFNGCTAVVDGWDAETGRYCVQLASPSLGNYQQAKIKAENLRALIL